MAFETSVIPARTSGGESPRSAVAWPAILAGSFAAAAASVVLLVLGSALGLASSPWARTGTSAAAFGVGAAIWLIVTQWIASGVGGYLAGRLRTKWVGIHDHEVFFRDTAHGFITWAVATVVTAVVLASSLSSLVGAGTQAASTVAAGVAHGAAGAASQVLDPNAYFVDRLFRTAPGVAAPAAAPAASAPAAATGDSARPATADGGNATAAAPTAAPEASASAPTGGSAVRLEGSRLLLHGLAAGKLEPDDRTYLAQLVARQAGIPQADAEKRVDDVVTQAQAAEAQVKDAADAARRAAAKFSLYFCLSLLVGAFIASVAAAHGGKERDEYEALLLIDEPLRPVR
jgi:hypothetical protein